MQVRHIAQTFFSGPINATDEPSNSFVSFELIDDVVNVEAYNLG